jgi:hypothetical protein
MSDGVPPEGNGICDIVGGIVSYLRNIECRSVVEGGLTGAIRLSTQGGAVLPSKGRTGFLRKEMVYVTL